MVQGSVSGFWGSGFWCAGFGFRIFRGYRVLGIGGLDSGVSLRFGLPGLWVLCSGVWDPLRIGVLVLGLGLLVAGSGFRVDGGGHAQVGAKRVDGEVKGLARREPSGKKGWRLRVQVLRFTFQGVCHKHVRVVSVFLRVTRGPGVVNTVEV